MGMSPVDNKVEGTFWATKGSSLRYEIAKSRQGTQLAGLGEQYKTRGKSKEPQIYTARQGGSKGRFNHARHMQAIFKVGIRIAEYHACSLIQIPKSDTPPNNFHVGVLRRKLLLHNINLRCTFSEIGK
jgi:hypothetical protein